MNQQEKIVIELVERKPEGEKLKEFLKICFDISDTLSLNSHDTMQMLKEEVQQAKRDFNERLKQLGRTPLEDGSVGSPCGVCREYLMQLDKDSEQIEILTDYESMATITLGELIPDWWGKERMK